MAAAFRHHWPADESAIFQVFERAEVLFSDNVRRAVIDASLELRPEECGVDLAEDVRGAEVDPSVVVDLPTEEP